MIRQQLPDDERLVDHFVCPCNRAAVCRPCAHARSQLSTHNQLPFVTAVESVTCDKSPRVSESFNMYEACTFFDYELP